MDYQAIIDKYYPEANELKNIADEIRNKEESILVILAARNAGGLNLLVAASKGLVKEGMIVTPKNVTP